MFDAEQLGIVKARGNLQRFEYQGRWLYCKYSRKQALREVMQR
ncbi:hypothetical protein AB4851_13805 [Burkholderia sp. 22PA0099]